MRSILLTLLILLVQCAAITTAGRAATLETRESAVASVIAGAPVEVFCVSTYREWNTIPGAGIDAWRTLTLLGVRGRRRNLAYRAAMRAHADIATVPGYNWHGAC
jgi:hypothetical protein